MESKLHECSKCGESKLRNKFCPKDEEKSIIQPCSACESDARFLRGYKLTKKEFEKQMSQQGQKCPICLSNIAKNAMQVHRNDDAVVRGIFCSQKCFDLVSNGSTKKCLRAAVYLQKPGKSSPDIEDIIKRLEKSSITKKIH